MMDSDQDIDELILQVFEEQEDHFYFPVATQNTARSFVKALHAKGLSYEDIYQEIGEFEHNFNAWKKGLGRVGIGNRVIQRINKPLDEVLLSDDEEDVNEILNRIKDRDNKTRPTNDRVPEIIPPDITAEESRILKLKENIHRQKEEHSTSNDVGNSKTKEQVQNDMTNAWQERMDKKVKEISNSNPDIARVKETSPESPLSSRKHGKAPGAEFEQNQPGVVDFRSVLKRRTHGNEDRAAGAGDRRSMPVSLNALSESTVTKIGGSTDRIHKLTNGDKKEQINHQNVKNDQTKVDLRAKSAPKISCVEEKPVKSNREGLVLDLNNKSKDKADGKDLFEEKNDVEKEFESLVNSLHDGSTPNDMSGSKAAPLATEDMDDELSLSSSSPSVTEEESTEDEEEQQQQKQQQEEEEVSSSSESVQTEDSSVKNEDINNGRQEELESEEEEEEEEQPKVGENYDSDLDEENEDITGEGKKLSDQVQRYKEKADQREGPGYLYIILDSSAGTDQNKSRIKVGSSRMPSKRLEQALNFNVNLEMISAVPVSLRRLALQRVYSRLSTFKLGRHDSWFEGPQDEIVRTVMSIAERYPKNSSMC